MQKEKGIVSIKVKLLGVIVPVVIVSILVLVLIAYRTSAGLIESYSENLLESSVENQASQIESWLEQNIGAFQIVKTTIENTKPDDKELQTMLDSYYNYNSNYPEGLYIADETGKLWKASDSAMSESDPVNSVWYQEGLTRVNMAIGSSYVNSEGVNVISASGILNDGSGKMKVISADMTLDRISVIVNAFIEMVKQFGMDEYEFAVREEKTYEVIEDVKTFRSEIGILYLNDFNRKVLTKLFDESDLEFCPLMDCGIYVYLWKGHPLANQKEITIEELQEYPCLSFEQGNYNSFYFAEEVLSTYSYKQLIKANDRATLLNLMVGLNGYTLCSGILCDNLNGSDYWAVKLKSDEVMTIGYLKRKGIALSPLGQKYLEEIRKFEGM